VSPVLSGALAEVVAVTLQTSMTTTFTASITFDTRATAQICE
jgi:hypothetical protein